MSIPIWIMSLLASFAGAAAGAIVMAWYVKIRQRNLLQNIDGQISALAQEFKAGQLLETVDKRLKEFSRVSESDSLMTTPTDRLSSILGRWHQYNVTRKNGLSTWIHVEYEISATPAGALEFSVEYSDNQGGRAEYLYEGVMRDDRVVLIGRPAAGGQACFVEIWPHLANKALKHHFGICLNESWDQQETVIPCLMSRTRIDPFNDEVMDSLWIAHLHSPAGPDIFPRLRSRLGGP